ncbi:MAG: FAD-binding oxidoreductase [Candidatus Eisenbacteria bacterium]|uniref:FAD-binding oxidoreductase n=1 Tax=Eiseniibacteriota bacterium TaxID=2212470 RepID=A0A538U6X4_UNCEI|nr:MAG: FAD-binding oxidoreductase [Candidatus Eisenbacteria bacterium]
MGRTRCARLGRGRRRLLRADGDRRSSADRPPRVDPRREMTSGEEIPFLSRPPSTADLVIVGGGVVGIATAFFAARAGLDTLVLEKRPALGTLSTSAATGAFRLQFDNADELAVVRESVSFFRCFAERTGLVGHDLGLATQGYLWVATDDATARRQRERVERQRAWGLEDVEVLESRELRRRFPYLDPSVIQARYRALDGWLDPRKLCGRWKPRTAAS